MVLSWLKERRNERDVRAGARVRARVRVYVCVRVYNARRERERISRIKTR